MLDRLNIENEGFMSYKDLEETQRLKALYDINPDFSRCLTNFILYLSRFSLMYRGLYLRYSP